MTAHFIALSYPLKLGTLPSPPDTSIHLVNDEQTNKVAASSEVFPHTHAILLKLYGEDSICLLLQHCELCAFAQ